jgi:AhpD family alkylhydroperoxidase
MTETAPARIPPGGFRELGPINWAIAKLGARAIRAPKFHLFNVLGQHRLLFLAWLPFSGMLLSFGKLSRKDVELVILRVGHLRACEYELQQHRRLARSRGVGPELQAKVFEGPDAEGLTERQRVLITATDEFVITRSMSPETWAALSGMLTKPQLIEFCTLAGQYDALAATVATLKIPLDFPD